MKRISRIFSKAWAVLLLAGLIPVLQAQPLGQAERSLEQQSDPHALLREMEEVQQELLQIQESVMAHNPELQAQAQALQELMLQTMQAEGYEPIQSLDRMEQLERQLQDDETDPAELSGLAAELRSEQQRLMQAEQAALANPKVQRARDQFMEALLQAMREQEPRTDELIAELQAKNEQLRDIVSAHSGGN